MNASYQNLKNQIKADPLFSLFIIAGIGLVAGLLLKKKPVDPISDADRRLRELLKEEEHQSRPFPKDVDLEPAFE